jgi:cold shock CspA family protein
MKEAEVIPILTPERVRGKIVSIKEDAGYGFITSDDKPFTRFFFFWTYLPGNVSFLELKYGQDVEFTPLKDEEKGWKAVKIELIGNQS